MEIKAKRGVREEKYQGERGVTTEHEVLVLFFSFSSCFSHFLPL